MRGGILSRRARCGLLLRAPFAFHFLALFVLVSSCQAQTVGTAARVEAVRFESKLVGKALPYNVVLPPLYDAPQTRALKYPVVYLLHGLGGGSSDWVSRTRLAEHAAAYRLIIVTPEGRDGWYTDSATAPDEKFETYFLEELIPDVERKFRTLPARDARAVAGLSMGGYGALKFGIKHPERFAFAASLSGAFDAASWDASDPKLLAFVKPSIARTYGASCARGQGWNPGRRERVHRRLRRAAAQHPGGCDGGAADRAGDHGSFVDSRRAVGVHLAGLAWYASPA